MDQLAAIAPLKTALQEVVDRAKSLHGLSSNETLAHRIGVAGQSLANACGQSRADMLSKDKLDAVIALAEMAPRERDAFDAKWLAWKLTRNSDGGVAAFLLSVVQDRVTPEELAIIKKECVRLRHSADSKLRP